LEDRFVIYSARMNGCQRMIDNGFTKRIYIGANERLLDTCLLFPKDRPCDMSHDYQFGKAEHATDRNTQVL
jgi:hypothetical protein